MGERELNRNGCFGVSAEESIPSAGGHQPVFEVAFAQRLLMVESGPAAFR
jgi:hypothetical protein